MSQFRQFDVDKRSKFLDKARDSKAKREEQLKRTKAVLLIQKNIRAHLASTQHANSHHSLLIRTPAQLLLNLPFLQSLLAHPQKHPPILNRKILALVIESIMHSKPQLNVSSESLLRLLGEVARAGKVGLAKLHYGFLVGNYFELLCQTHLIPLLYQEQNFQAALLEWVGQDIHRLVWIIWQINDTGIANQAVIMFELEMRGRKPPRRCSQEGPSLEDVIESYERVVQLLKSAVARREEDRGFIYLLSLLIPLMKQKHIDEILLKYKIDEQLFLSPSLKEESQEIIKQKKEWKEYEQALLSLAHLQGHFLSKFYTYGPAEVQPVLSVVIELSKLNYSFGSLRLEGNEFFMLIDRLDFKMPLGREAQELKFDELFFLLSILKNYLESINDMQFRKDYQFDSQRLQKAIKNSLIRFMKAMCTVANESEIFKEVLEVGISFMSNLYNKVFRTHLLPTSVFEDGSLVVFSSNQKLSSYGNASYFNELRKIVERAPFLMPIQTRFLMFRNIVNEHRSLGYHGVHQLKIRRGHQFEDAFSALYRQNMKDRMRVVFVNQHGFEEAGMDAGGLTKELLTRVFKVAFSPNFGLFTENGQRELMPHPNYKDIETGSKKSKEFEFVGQLLGKSLYENIMLGIKFAGPFLNLLINRRNSFDDLEAIDPELYRSLAYIATMESGVEEMELRFQYPEGERVVNLVPRGDKIRVTDHNKMHYINMLINYKVNKAFERQTWFIRRGLKSVIDEKWVQMFNYAELNYLISGTGSIDVADWENHARFVGDCDQAFIRDFWQTVRQFSDEERSLLLKFVTSCERPSFLGFRDLMPPFTVQVQGEGMGLPVAHTCSNVMVLPKYPSRAVLKEKLLYGIRAEAGFEFV